MKFWQRVLEYVIETGNYVKLYDDGRRLIGVRQTDDVIADRIFDSKFCKFSRIDTEGKCYGVYIWHINGYYTYVEVSWNLMNRILENAANGVKYGNKII